MKQLRKAKTRREAVWLVVLPFAAACPEPREPLARLQAKGQKRVLFAG